MPTPSPPIQSRSRTSLPRSGRVSETARSPRPHDRPVSRSRSRSTSSAEHNYRQRRRHDDRKHLSLGRKEGEIGRRHARRSMSSSADEAPKPHTGTRRSRSRSKDRSGDRPRTKASTRATSPARAGNGEWKDRRAGALSPPPKRRDTSRDRYAGQKERKPRQASRDRQMRSKSRERRSRDTATEKELKPRDGPRERRPKYRSRSRDQSRDRSRDRRKRRQSRSPSPYRASKRRDRSDSPRRKPRSSRSPSHKGKRVKPRSLSPPTRSRKPLPSQEMSFRGGPDSGAIVKEPVADKQMPNLAPSGILAREANKVVGTNISLKYHEPPEARKPPSSAQWRIFVFKGKDMLETIELYPRSVWLLGRAPEVADIVLAHPSSSQQHAAIQFRHIVKKLENEYGVTQKKGKVKPYIIDLESSNGTFLNGEKLEGGRYVEIRDGDLLKFGGSEREYVVMLPPPDKG